MKNFIGRLAIAVGVTAAPASVIFAQETGNATVAQICTDPAFSGVLEKVWNGVQATGKLEAHVAFLTACGDSAAAAKFTALARAYVVEQAAAGHVPKYTITLNVTGSENDLDFYGYTSSDYINS